MNNENETLFDKAIQNYNCALTLYNSELIEDEAYFNYIGYHLQQVVELAMKDTLEINGVEYGKTHDIEQLIQLGNSTGVDLHITDYIDDKAEMFSSWEAKTRYIKNYKLERRKVETALKEVKKYIDAISLSKQERNINEDIDKDNISEPDICDD